MLSRSTLLFVGALAGAFAVAPTGAQQTASVPAKTAAPRALDRANLDTTCAACSDFYTFANGGWLKRTTIPAKYGEWGAFDQLQDQNETIVREIVEAAAADVKAGKAKAPSNGFKIGAFYAACVDTAAIEALGTKPIEAPMARIAAIKSSADLPAALTILEKSDGLAPFGVGAGPDLKNSDRIIASAGQGGLSLPEKNYYISQDTSMQGIRDKFERHVAAMFKLDGESDADAAAHAKTVLAIETKFAAASMDRVTMRNPDATYHVMTVAQFDSIAPRLKWETFLTTMGAPSGLNDHQRLAARLLQGDGRLPHLHSRRRLENAAALAPAQHLGDPPAQAFRRRRLCVPENLHGTKGALAAMADVRAKHECHPR